MKNLLLILALFVVSCSSPTYTYLECKVESSKKIYEFSFLPDTVYIRIDDKNKMIRFGLFDEVPYLADNEQKIETFIDSKREPGPYGKFVRYNLQLYLEDLSLQLGKQKIMDEYIERRYESLITNTYQCAVKN